MKPKRSVIKNDAGFTLLEVTVAVAIFLIFAVGIYSATVFISKIVYQSRMSILETAVLSEELEVVRNLPYASIGIVNGVPSGVLTRTKSVTRDGAEFTIVTTVRNVDDPFDGTAGGSPNDLSPADFKLVEMSALCNACGQQTPVVLSTTIGPKALEGATQNGALFINVFDAQGEPVVGANVHVWNTQYPGIAIDDTTDKDGYLHIVDTPTGTATYGISVTKPGYSTDYTITSTAANPNPTKPPANVVTQRVTDISLSIDKLSNMTVHTISQACAAIPNIGFSVQGTKLLGTNPTVYKYNNTFTTDGSGNKVLNPLEWDTYFLALTGQVYDIAGSIPLLPDYLGPDSSDDVSLILRAHSTNSLLVQVEDAATKLPLSNITARLTNASGYDKSVLTGLGYVRQTDWSGGSGASTFVEGRYFSNDDGNLVMNNPAGDVILKKTGAVYKSSGELQSATFDLGTTVNFNNVLLQPTAQSPQAGTTPLQVQIATSNSSTPVSWNFLGPDGTVNSWYTITSTVVAPTSSGKRYMRYKARLTTANTAYTARLSEIAFTYTDSCIPPGQTFFDTLSAATYTLTLSGAGYVTTTSTIDVAGADSVRIPLAEQ